MHHARRPPAPTSSRLVRRHAQRLFGKYVLARAQDLAVNLRVQVVRRAVVHRVQTREREQFLHAGAAVRYD